MLAGPVVAVVSLLLALLATQAAGVPLRDPEYAIAQRLVLVGCLVAALAVIDIVARAGLRSGRRLPSRVTLRSVRRERWPRGRALAVGSALVSFYVTYLAYRNVKSVVPLLRPGEGFDRQLAEFDRDLFGGNDPAQLLHALLGTGFATEALAVVYVAFFYFAMLTLPLALVFLPPRGGIFYALALSLNWALGAVSYVLLPARGPIYADFADFVDLPATQVSRLQDVLIRQRFEFLAHPGAPDAHQGIAAFGSLHTSIIFTAAVAAHLLGLDRRLRIGLWAMFSLTAVATIYLGWHYVADDLAALIIGVAAIALACGLTGFALRIAWRPRILKRAAISVPAAIAKSGQDITFTRALDASAVETSSGSDAA